MTKKSINKKAITEVTRREKLKKDQPDLDCGDSKSCKSFEDAQINKGAVIQVNKEEKSKELAGIDCGDSKSGKSFKDILKKNPDIKTRIKQMVKGW